EGVAGGTLALVKPSLEVEGGRLRLGDLRTLAVPYDPRLLPTVRPGSPVVLHWGLPVLELVPDQLRAVQEYSQRSWEAANEVLADLDVFDARPS
ncbi:MAG TPA: hypothetical protein VMH90_01770, partial [Thermoplasmata archaeon]|nr:hypothetical protein [Thermoplasmata archaeon]